MKVIGFLSFILLGLLLWLVFVLPFTGWHVNTGSGEHTGYVTAVERNGIFFKTGRVYIKTDISSSQEDYYCITDDVVYAKLEELARTQEKVTVQYHSWLVAGVTNCQSEQAVINAVK